LIKKVWSVKKSERSHSLATGKAEHTKGAWVSEGRVDKERQEAMDRFKRERALERAHQSRKHKRFTAKKIDRLID
jgi:hypothetical protein